MKKLLFLFTLSLFIVSCFQDSEICINEKKIDASVDCDSLYNPVCGCDNMTYYNACEAENKAGISIYSEGLCEHTCTYNDTLMVLASAENCTVLTNFIDDYEIDYSFENVVWENDKYYLINALESNKTPYCGGAKSIHILCALLYDQSCSSLISTSGIDNQLPNDSLKINGINLTNNCLNINYSYLGGCDDTRLNLHHLVDSSTSEVVRLQLRYDNGDGPCIETLIEDISFNLSSLQIGNQNEVTISIDCNGDDSFSENIKYEY